MRTYGIGAAVCLLFGLAFFATQEATAQSIQQFGSVMRVELTDRSDNAIIERFQIRRRVYLRLKLPREAPRTVQANGVTMIWVDAKRGNDTVTFQGNMSAYTASVTLGEGDDYVDLGSCADGIVDGESGNDTIFGSDGFDDIKGGSGNDIIHGLGNFDILDGGLGSDTVFGGDGDDWIRGGQGEGEGGLWGGNGADRFYVLPSHWMQAYQLPSDYNGSEGDQLFQVDLNWWGF
jgi:hypothetical protein